MIQSSLPPVIKWSGSKRPVARALHCLWPSAITGTTYFEPFLGGGSMLPDRPIRNAVAGDSIAELVELWKTIQTNPEQLIAHYSEHWQRRQDEGHTVYYKVRARFNELRSPLDLLFLSRTCVNGLIRFNAKGEFNNSLHHTRPGINPNRFAKTVRMWSTSLRGVRFVTGDFQTTLAEVRAGDLVFLDPPYAGNVGRYMPSPFEFGSLWEELHRLNSLGAYWILTLDGKAGTREYEHGVPDDLFAHHLGIGTGNPPFTRLMGASIDRIVESVFLNFDPPRQSCGRSYEALDQPSISLISTEEPKQHSLPFKGKG